MHSDTPHSTLKFVEKVTKNSWNHFFKKSPLLFVPSFRNPNKTPALDFWWYTLHFVNFWIVQLFFVCVSFAKINNFQTNSISKPFKHPKFWAQLYWTHMINDLFLRITSVFLCRYIVGIYLCVFDLLLTLQSNHLF